MLLSHKNNSVQIWGFEPRSLDCMSWCPELRSEAPSFFPHSKASLESLPHASWLWDLGPSPPSPPVTMLERGPVLHILCTFQLCLPKTLWGLTGKHPYSSKGPVNQKVNVDSKDFQGTADGATLRNTKHSLQAW